MIESKLFFLAIAYIHTHLALEDTRAKGEDITAYLVVVTAVIAFFQLLVIYFVCWGFAEMWRAW